MNELKRFSILLLFSLSFACSLFAKPTNVIYLIPEGFTGGVIVLYNQPDGIEPEKSEDGTIVYRIPKDGFLKVNSPLNEGKYRFKYYFVDEKDKRIEIEYVYPEAYVRNPGDTTTKSLDSITEDEKNNGIFIMNHRTVSFKNNGNKTVLYALSVGHPKDSRSIYIETDIQIGKIEKELSNNKFAPENGKN